MNSQSRTSGGSSPSDANIVVVILALNEEKHILRSLASVASFASRCVVIDSGSSDRTVELALQTGAQVLTHAFKNHADQFNWALNQLESAAEWVLRLDADEIVTPALAAEICNKLPSLGPETAGVYVLRRMMFLGRPIRHGGVSPIRILRLFRKASGHCENRWMDEHIVVRGKTVSFQYEILDNNLNSLTWWTQKHNIYAAHEVVDLLNLKYSFLPHESIASLRSKQLAGVKRWIKERIYVRLPGGLRALIYFLYRYLFRLGFLDGREGTVFHVLQGFWYRFLVDAKLYEVKRCMKNEGLGVVQAIEKVLGINVT